MVAPGPVAKLAMTRSSSARENASIKALAIAGAICGKATSAKALKGVDSLYSIVQMPKGIPVGTLAIGSSGAANAGILAAEIIGLESAQVKKKLVAYKKSMAEGVAEKAAKLKKTGYKNYKK